MRIACFRSVATHVVPAVIARFRIHFPEIAVTISEHYEPSDVEQALRKGHADIGFTYLPTSDEFETWEFMRDEYIALLPRTTKLSSPQLTWKQLATYPLLLTTCALKYLKIEDHFKHCEHPLKIAYEVREDSTIVSMVEQGLGMAILPRLAAEPLPPGVQVCSLPVPWERVIGVAVLANSLQTPAVFAFLDTLRSTAQLTVKTAV